MLLLLFSFLTVAVLYWSLFLRLIILNPTKRNRSSLQLEEKKMIVQVIKKRIVCVNDKRDHDNKFQINAHSEKHHLFDREGERGTVIIIIMILISLIIIQNASKGEIIHRSCS